MFTVVDTAGFRHDWLDAKPVIFLANTRDPSEAYDMYRREGYKSLHGSSVTVALLQDMSVYITVSAAPLIDVVMQNAMLREAFTQVYDEYDYDSLEDVANDLAEAFCTNTLEEPHLRVLLDVVNTYRKWILDAYDIPLLIGFNGEGYIYRLISTPKVISRLSLTLDVAQIRVNKAALLQALQATSSSNIP
jgi:hypothetical protein